MVIFADLHSAYLLLILVPMSGLLTTIILGLFGWLSTSKENGHILFDVMTHTATGYVLLPFSKSLYINKKAIIRVSGVGQTGIDKFKADHICQTTCKNLSLQSLEDNEEDGEDDILEL